MAKETTHRADELKNLGWSNDDVLRYMELWDYRQRWGAINLERDDRQFLRQAESALPKIVSGKSVPKKPTQEKSYYRWLKFYLNSMDQAESDYNLGIGARGVWALLLEEELRAIDYFEPVLGLPDTIKAKGLDTFRESVVERISTSQNKNIQNFKFDFIGPLKALKEKDSNSWRFLRDSSNSEVSNYPVLLENVVDEIRLQIRKEILPLLKETFPSLAESEKSFPPDDWSRN